MNTELRQVLDALVERGSVSADVVSVKRLLIDDSARLKGIARSLIEVLALSEDEIADAICSRFRFARMQIVHEMESAPANILTDDEIRHYNALPVFRIGLELTIAFIDPPSSTLNNFLQKLSGCRIKPVITTVSDFEAALKNYKGGLDKLQKIVTSINFDKLDIKKLGEKGATKAMEAELDGMMSDLVNELLLRAAKSGASDIHVEPLEHELLIRFRIDGVLQRILSLPIAYHPAMIAVFKSRSGIDIFQRGIPQDGRITMTFADREFDVRVSTLPLLKGEKMVLRLLSKTSMMINLENLGFSESNLRQFRSLLALPNGIVLVTGPTGSGKTTSLYAGLNEIKSIGTNITTVENPVEYKLDLINQVQVMAERGLTFATSLRAILRQDPDVVLVGEIRDVETGTIATEAALTGHLVLSTLHTNDAIGAIPRMINLGIEAFWVSASVIGIVAQRLVRRICARCKEEYEPTPERLEAFGLSNLPKGTTLFRGKGCEYCSGIGFKGRVAIHEVLVITEEMRDVIFGEVTTGKLRKLALANNFRDMLFDGVQKSLAGITTVDEVRRVIPFS
ncbi:MAG: GspE/PulE family protein [Ignavibacteriales bacterium]|nr:GspE/PulE family protein [Ignavibacteriales bacterium]